MIELSAPSEVMQRWSLAARRAGLALTAALVTVNVWTGCPLLALWIGSQAADSHELSMPAVVATIAALGVLEFAMVLVLAWLTGLYDELIGLVRPAPEATWTRRICAPESAGLNRRLRLSSLEGIVVINVYVAVITLIVWYLFFASHPAPLLCAVSC
jgi:hypothetical protein